MSIQPVTMLFDISRRDVDGRDNTKYLQWSHELLSIFPNALVFHDGSANILRSKFPNATFILIDKKDLKLYKDEFRISNMCKTYLRNGKNDLIYRLPNYGIIVNSKFELIQRAQTINNSEYFMWVDVGLTRFLSESEKRKIANLDDYPIKVDIFFEIDFRRNLTMLQFLRGKGFLRVPISGTSRRVVGGGLFIVRSQYLSEFYYKVNYHHEEWLSKDEWDSEQVALAQLIRGLSNIGIHRQKSKSSTSILKHIIERREVRPLANISRFALLGLRNKYLFSKFRGLQ